MPEVAWRTSSVFRRSSHVHARRSPNRVTTRALTAEGAGVKLLVAGAFAQSSLADQKLRQGTQMNSRDEVEFGVEVAHLDGEIVLAVRGEVDAASAAAFRAAVEAFDGEGGRLVFELNAVSFMDSSGLNVVARTLRRQQRSGGSLCIRNPRRQARQLLTMSGLDQHVTIEETVAHTLG